MNAVLRHGEVLTKEQQEAVLLILKTYRGDSAEQVRKLSEYFCQFRHVLEARGVVPEHLACVVARCLETSL